MKIITSPLFYKYQVSPLILITGCLTSFGMDNLINRAVQFYFQNFLIKTLIFF